MKKLQKIFKQVKLFDILIFSFLLCISILIIKFSFSKKGNKVVVTVDNDTYEFPLTEESHIYKIQGPLGYTEIEIFQNQVRIVDSPCPNKTCVNFGFSNPIICLPNHLIVELEIQDVESTGGFDAISE